ncbi:MAG TPA: peptidylprolyl isomerase [Fimbriimonadaceae bacterium]|nr:peptidylprolyl isomerase [Fimbriimonadaceae bacterium]
MRVALFLLPLLLLLVGCEEPAKPRETATKPAANTPDPAPVLKEMDIDQVPDEAHKPLTNPKDGEEVAVFETNLGKIVVRFFPDVAPKHVENVLKLAKEGYYDGTKLHRVLPGFMIQGGDPNSKDDDRMNDGAGGPGYTVKGEFNRVPHVRGILSTARTMDPDSAGSQFFVVVADSHFLNPKFYEDGKVVPGKEGYTVFGAVVSGIEVADKIVNLPRDANDNPLPDNPAVLKKVKIAKWPVK